MAEKRKLQCDIDKCIKKINEGVEEFDTIWQKLQTAPSNNLKEKHETDLKKEIKKLQRLRELLKTYLSSNDVKDKTQLLETRKLIENQMEKYKVFEKDFKNKNPSKDNCNNSNKCDLNFKSKEECHEWINTITTSLKQHKKALESDLENISSSTKVKKKADKGDSLNEKINKLKKHLGSLQVINQMLIQDSLDFDDVNCIKDDVENYLDHIQDPSFIENNSIYESLNLDFDCLSMSLIDTNYPSNTTSVAAVSTSPQNSSFSSNKSTKNSKLNNQSNPAYKNQTLSSHNANIATTSLNNQIINNNISKTIADATQQKFRNNNIVPSIQNVISNNQTLLNHNSNASLNGSSDDRPLTQVISSTVSFLKTSNMLLTNSDAPNQSPSKIKQNTNSSILSYSSAVNNSNLNYESTFNIDKLNSYSKVDDSSSTGSKNESYHSNMYNERSIKPKSTSNDGKNGHNNKIFNYSNENKTTTPHENESWSNVVRSISNNSDVASTNTFNSSLKPSQTKSNNGGNFKKPDSINSTNKTNNLVLKKEMIPVKNNQWVGKKSNDYELLVQCLTHSLKKNKIEFLNFDKNRLNMLKPYSMNQRHHQPMSWCFDNLSYYSNFSNETLFFIFYYFEGTRSQYLAAKTLKSKMWRYHTMLYMWFMRYDDPKVITDDYEQGNYIFFDYEKWLIRRNDNFTFEYQYLDDKDL